MKSIVSNQPPVTFQADREHDNSHFGWILPRTLIRTMPSPVHTQVTRRDGAAESPGAGLGGGGRRGESGAHHGARAHRTRALDGLRRAHLHGGVALGRVPGVSARSSRAIPQSRVPYSP